MKFLDFSHNLCFAENSQLQKIVTSKYASADMFVIVSSVVSKIFSNHTSNNKIR